MVTNLAVLDFGTPGPRDEAGSVHPGVEVGEVVAATGFPLAVPDRVPVTRRPGRGAGLGRGRVAMGTRFLLTSDSPVPDAVKQVYLAAGLDGTVVTPRVDGVPHRVLRTSMVDQLERGGQVLVAANTPVLLRAAMVDGRTDLGLMSSGQVAGLIEDLPSCAELIGAIMREAEVCLERIATFRSE